MKRIKEEWGVEEDEGLLMVVSVLFVRVWRALLFDFLSLQFPTTTMSCFPSLPSSSLLFSFVSFLPSCVSPTFLSLSSLFPLSFFLSFSLRSF
jgi:hypothetical protein